MTNTQILTLAAAFLTAAAADFDAYVTSKKADPTARWEWWPFLKRTVLGLIIGLTGGAAIVVGGGE